MNSDIQIATAQSPKDVSDLAAEIGLLPHEFDLYGKKKAKVSLKVLDRLAHQQNGNYVIVTGSVLCVSFMSVTKLFHVSGSGHWVTGFMQRSRLLRSQNFRVQIHK